MYCVDISPLRLGYYLIVAYESDYNHPHPQKGQFIFLPQT